MGLAVSRRAAEQDDLLFSRQRSRFPSRELFQGSLGLQRQSGALRGCGATRVGERRRCSKLASVARPLDPTHRTAGERGIPGVRGFRRRLTRAEVEVSRCRRRNFLRGRAVHPVPVMGSPLVENREAIGRAATAREVFRGVKTPAASSRLEVGNGCSEAGGSRAQAQDVLDAAILGSSHV